MPIGPTNKAIKIKWFRDSGELRTKKEEFDNQDLNCWWTENPKKKEFTSYTNHEEVVFASVEIILSDKPKLPIKQASTLIESEGQNYSVVNIDQDEFGAIYAGTVWLKEHKGETP